MESVGHFLCLKVLYGICWPFPLRVLLGLHWSFPLFESFVWNLLVFASESFVWNLLALFSVWKFCMESAGPFLCLKVLYGICWPFSLKVLYEICWPFSLFESFVWNLLALFSVWKFCMESAGPFLCLKVLYGICWPFSLFESFVWNLLALFSVAIPLPVRTVAGTILVFGLQYWLYLTLIGCPLGLLIIFNTLIGCPLGILIVFNTDWLSTWNIDYI